MLPKVLLLLPLLVACAACRAREPGPNPFSDAELIVLSDFAHPPFAYLGAADEPRGFEVELVEELAARMGRTAVWRRHPFHELIERIEAGEGHLVAATIGINPERASTAYFSRPYCVTDLVVLVRAGAGEPLGLHQLSGRPVAAAPGTHAAYVLRQALPDSLAVLAETERERVDRLLGGQIDAIVLDRRAADRLRDQGLPVTILGPRLAREEYALVFPGQRPRLRQEVDRHLRAMDREGVLARLRQEYELDAANR